MHTILKQEKLKERNSSVHLSVGGNIILRWLNCVDWIHMAQDKDESAPSPREHCNEPSGYINGE
jgi:hypothetical protein